LATTYNNIGLVYDDQGKLELALEMYLKCLNIDRAYYGNNNFNLAGTYSNIGEICR
jgi:tetratricopeptide (TPR) repeat protein